MKEKLVKKVIEVIFIVRYWAVLTLLVALGYATYYVSQQPEAGIRDSVAVFTGGAVMITILYHVLNYEYNQRKFKHDIQSSKYTLSFNTVLEWQKDHMTKNVNNLRTFYLKHQAFLDDGTPRKFQEELEKAENEVYYTALLCVLNFFETISLGIKQDIMDEEFTKGFFGSIFTTQYNRYNVYIHYRRKSQSNPKIWVNFTYLAEKWISC